jgi:chromosome segregation protein
LPGQSELLSIERSWSADLREEFRVEGQAFQKEEVENYLESMGLAYSNPYHIVQQGRIDLVVRMDDFELYALLEDATGLGKYERRREETQAHLRRNAMQKEEIATMLAEIEAKLRVYEAHKEEYEVHNCEELVQKLRSKQ